jgi:hypothetical protein
MAAPLIAYLRDHLAGARFAISLLHDLSSQVIDRTVAETAAGLLPAIEEDRSALEDCLRPLGDDGSKLNDVTAWVAQKASRFKLRLNEPFGLFEAIEMLSLGVLGKLAMWNALNSLKVAGLGVKHFDCDRLILRARDQHQQLETLRLRLAVETLNRDGAGPR